MVSTHFMFSSKKSFPCDASIFLLAWLETGDRRGQFTLKELRGLAFARKCGWRIRKGDTYIYQVAETRNKVTRFRAIPQVHAICLNKKLYKDKELIKIIL